jgi:hypothetical protein
VAEHQLVGRAGVLLQGQRPLQVPHRLSLAPNKFLLLTLVSTNPPTRLLRHWLTPKPSDGLTYFLKCAHAPPLTEEKTSKLDSRHFSVDFSLGSYLTTPDLEPTCCTTLTLLFGPEQVARCIMRPFSFPFYGSPSSAMHKTDRNDFRQKKRLSCSDKWPSCCWTFSIRRRRQTVR